ncbi:hypothetical protein Tco_1334407, partial [Tanacetum coccineum]
RTPTITKPSCLAESSSLYVELGLTDSETDFDEEVGSNPGDAAMDQPQSSHVVHARPNLDHMDLGINLKLPTNDQIILKEHATSTGTLSSLQNLDREISFTNQFLEERSREDEPNKTNTEAEKSLERDHSDQLASDLKEACLKKRKKRAALRTPSGSPPS